MLYWKQNMASSKTHLVDTDSTYVCVSVRVCAIVRMVNQMWHVNELLNVKDCLATRTTIDHKLRATLGRLQLLWSSEWQSEAQQTKGKKKRCERRQKRGKCSAVRSRLKTYVNLPIYLPHYNASNPHREPSLCCPMSETVLHDCFGCTDLQFFICCIWGKPDLKYTAAVLGYINKCAEVQCHHHQDCDVLPEPETLVEHRSLLSAESLQVCWHTETQEG